MSDRKTYGKLIEKAKENFREYKTTGNLNAKRKSDNFYAQADFLKEKSITQDCSTKIINIDIDNRKSKTQNILSNNKTKTSVNTKYKRKNK